MARHEILPRAIGYLTVKMHQNQFSLMPEASKYYKIELFLHAE